jgi:hypothetical protein
MNYHARDIEVKYENECTLENLIGLSDFERELIAFGSSDFNSDRRDRWPTTIKDRRARALNNLNNAAALKKKGSLSAIERESKWRDELASIAHEARELHRQGELLSERLRKVSKLWGAAQRANDRQENPLPIDQLARKLWEPVTLERVSAWQRRERYRQRHKARRIPHLWSKRYDPADRDVFGADVRKIGTLVPQKKPLEVVQKRALRRVRSRRENSVEQIDRARRRECALQEAWDAGPWRDLGFGHWSDELSPPITDTPDGPIVRPNHEAKPSPRPFVIRPAEPDVGFAHIADFYRWRRSRPQDRVRLGELAQRLVRAHPMQSNQHVLAWVDHRKLHAAMKLDVAPRTQKSRAASWTRAQLGKLYRERFHVPSAHAAAHRMLNTNEARKRRENIEQLFDVVECVGFLQYFNRNRAKGTT